MPVLTYRTWSYQAPLFKDDRIVLTCPHCFAESRLTADYFYSHLRSLLGCEHCGEKSKLPDIGVT